MINSPRHRMSLAMAVCVVSLLTACESTTTEGTPPDTTVPSVTGVTVTSPATTVSLGSTLQMTATVLPSTVSQGVSWASSDVSKATVSNSGLVTAVFPGKTLITATSTADPTKSATANLTVTGCIPLVSADVANGATLLEDVCYSVQNPLSVTANTLTIQPGVRMEFAANGSLSIGTNGRLNAIGTATKPILLTSSSSVGSWRGVRFDNSRGAENVLRYVTIDKGGSAGWSGAAYSSSGLLLEGNTLVDMQNSTISGSKGQGITLYSGAEMNFQNNTLQGNLIAAWVHPNTAQYISNNTVFTGNTSNVVRVSFGNTDAVSTAQTWQTLAVPYEVQARTFINAALVLDHGVTIAMQDDVEWVVQNLGSITANGTAASPITFTSVANAPDSWKGLRIATASANNRFNYVRFENGGSVQWTGAGDSRAMVYLDANSKALFTNSTFRGSGHYGLWVPASGDIAGFSNNTFTANARAMIVHPTHGGSIAANNVFTGNTENKVRMTFGNSDRVLTAQTWKDFGAPIYVVDRTFIEASLTILAGVEIEFAQNASFRVTEGGSLRVDGTVGNVVAFRGGQALTGYWQGIEYNTANVNNVITHATFSNAGSDAWFGGANSTSTINITADGTLTLANVSFASTGGYAVIVRNGGVLNCANVTLGGFQTYIYNNSGNAAVSSCNNM